MIINIQGLDIHYRDLIESKVEPDGSIVVGEEILYSDLPQDQQYFKRVEDPFTDIDQLVEISELPYDERSSKYTNIQSKWVEIEEKRMTYGNGVYAMINGLLTYIPASYWGYINHWTLERGDKPDYREADRLFFLFMEYICFETDVLCITRGKGRRQGATSIGFFWMWWICGRMEEKIGGSISFNEEAANKNFSGMFMRGFKDMNPCFVRDFDSSSEKFVRFVRSVEKAKRGVIKKREGLKSKVDVLPTTINSYDSGMVNFGLFDEPGKYDKMNVNTYWSKVSPTLKIGREKVGFAYMPTTVNPKKKGGEHYKQFWKEANQNAINDSTGKPYGLNTPHKVVKYFVPATEGYAGCIDKFGNSIINDPKEPVMGNKGKWISEGSLSVIKHERSLKKGEQKMEHQRDFPLDEFDMFAFETGLCEFNQDNFIDRIQFLEDHPEKAYWRQVRLYEVYNEVKKRMEVEFADDPKGECWFYERPVEPNKFSSIGSLEPQNTLLYSAGADTYRNIFAIDGSEGALYVFKKSLLVNGVETGLYPVFKFVGRPKLIKQFNRQAALMCLWYGCKINYEIDAGTWFYEDFAEWNMLRFLEWEPARDPIRKVKMIKPGTESAQPFQLAKQLEVAKLYFDGNRIDGYNGNVHRVTDIPLLKQGLEYNHSERTPYHSIVAFMMALLPCFAAPMVQRPVARQSILPTYKLKIPA